MQTRIPRGNKAPVRPRRSARGPQPTAGSRSIGTVFGNYQFTRKQSRDPDFCGNRPVSETSEMARQRLRGDSRNDSDSRRTATARAPCSTKLARAVSPRSHKRETMPNQARNHGKSTEYCNQCEIGPTTVDGLEPADVGSCDTPLCDGDAAVITPEGYVCDSCADEIAAAHERARERDRAAGGER